LRVPVRHPLSFPDGVFIVDAPGERAGYSVLAAPGEEFKMRKAIVVQSLAGILLFGVGVATGLVAQPNSDSPQRVEQKRADLSGASGMEVIASTAEYMPGEGVELHFHHGVEASYVVQGARVQSPGQEARTIATGATILNLRDVRHGGFKVVGDTPLKLFTVHVVDKGKPLYDYSK
jgi:quercetin dioxygenase-like cupin family protein